MRQRGFTSIIIIFFVLVASGAVAFYFLKPKSNSQQGSMKTAPSLPTASPKTRYTEQDGIVWSDISNIVSAVNIFYFDNKRLPKDLEELKTHPDLSNFVIKNNPITNQPYTYIPKQDNSGFTVSGMQSDGTEYKKEAPIN